MRIIWSPDADADRHRVWMFLAERSVAYADRAETRLLGRCDTLGGVARQGRPKPGLEQERELSIPDIQLFVTYRIDEERDTVRILRVRSTRQNQDEP